MHPAQSAMTARRKQGHGAAVIVRSCQPDFPRWPVRRKHTLFALCAKVRSSNAWPMSTKMIGCGMQPAMVDDAHLQNSVNLALATALAATKRSVLCGPRRRDRGSDRRAA